MNARFKQCGMYRFNTSAITGAPSHCCGQEWAASGAAGAATWPLAQPPSKHDICGMSLPPGFLEELRTRVPISQIVGRKVTWDSRKSKPSKGDFWAPCPFHHEKTASFHVEDGKGYFYCFGCHAKGDAVTFLRDSENMGFMEAVETLAREAGIPMPAQDPAAARQAAANKGLVEVMEAAVQFYRLQLKTARAGDARSYLDHRGLKPEIV